MADTTKRTRPLWADLTKDSSREEVFAALEEAESRRRDIGLDGHVFPERPNDFRGCLSCDCGEVLAMFGPIDENPTIAAQNRAGEEDQSQPGWDGA